jgi:hypothetical protein
MNEYSVDHGQIVAHNRLSANIVIGFFPLAQKIFFVSIVLIAAFNLLDFYLYEYQTDLSKRWLAFSAPVTTFMSHYVWSIDQIESDLRTTGLHARDTLSWYARIPVSKNVIAFDWVFSIVCVAGTILACLWAFLRRGEIVRATIEERTRGIRFARNWGGGFAMSLKAIALLYVFLTSVFALLILTDVAYANPIVLYENDILFMATIVYFYFWLPMPAATVVLCLACRGAKTSAEA